MAGQDTGVTLAEWDDEGPSVRLIRTRGEDVGEHIYAHGVHLAPPIGKHNFPTALRPDQWEKVCLVQQREVRKTWGSICIGGSMEAARLTADGVTVGWLADYPGKVDSLLAIRRAQEDMGVYHEAPPPLDPFPTPAKEMVHDW
ncbi:hypothetical protein [Rhodospirillum sp. A1_3_36]|uniref:hypothetical protein n=1 Tax=Rhodospirillum sp. A1_3_36 TaxID=3391666 RepID=UPI0039A6A0C0